MPSDDYFHEGELVSVLTTEPLDRRLDYKAPEGGVHLGAYVQVPLGPRQVVGVVWGRGRGGFDLKKARGVHRVLDVAPMRAEMRSFLEKCAGYTLTPLSQMLRLATRAPGLANPPSMQKVYRRGSKEPERMTDARRRVLQVFDDYGGLAFTQRELADHAGVTPSVIKGMVKLGAVFEEDTPRDLPFPALQPDYGRKELTEAQEAASAELCERVRAEVYSSTLLWGVTGSGKTEVYLEAIAETLRKGRQALVLLPEIALSAEFMNRVEARFGARAAEWHSGVTMTERRRTWKMVGEGAAQLVIGARSALFLPFRDLGLVVVDEEHDNSYKQEDGVLYNARDMSVLRASLCSAQVVLASATPSLESWTNAQSGKYDLVELGARYGEAVLPELRAIDMRQVTLPSNRWISPVLETAVKTRMARGEQSLLFLNRRGYAPVTLCRKCGEQIGCDHCDARMVEHRFQKRLMCHQCGESKPIPEVCPSCDAEDSLAVVGPGVERLAEEAAERFEGARIAVLSSDLFGSARALKQQITDIAEGSADIIIGTQLVAKGHNFPLLTLVGVIDADLGLQGSDMRAAERSFQQMRQVSGRAGRAEKRGVAMLQTYQPEHPVLRAIMSGEERQFWRAEADERRLSGMPPFGRLAGIIISAPEAQDAYELGEHLARNAQALEAVGAQVFGPAPAPIARVRGRHRVRLLVKASKDTPLQAALGQWTKGLKLPNQLRLSIDIDPQNFF
ncbi:primosomal protein N' [Lentibacter algarum]|uniref:primosomal protein N' n=1 Tax=Lentibacter algarum TaxID=576131 RepID=UPI001C072A54|nr:primosomal protein N' [Lentibacter algarum]